MCLESPQDGSTALLEAASNGHADVANVLLGSGASLAARDSVGPAATAKLRKPLKLRAKAMDDGTGVPRGNCPELPPRPSRRMATQPSR